MAGTFQIGGLVSGLDTNKIIDQLMALERRPLEQLQTQQQRLQTRRQALSDLSSKLANVRTKGVTLALASTTSARQVTSSNTSVATAVAVAGTAVQSISLTVTRMATRTIATSASSIGQSIDSGAVLTSAGFGSSPTSGTFTINGTTISVDATVDTLDDVIARINTTFGGTVTAALDGTGNRLVLSSPAGPIIVGASGDTSNFLSVTRLAASSSTFNAGSGEWENISTGPVGVTQPAAVINNARLAALASTSGTFTIGGVSFDWDGSTDTLNGLISRINASAAGVIATYDAANDRFTLKNRNTGSTDITFADTSGNLMSALFNGGVSKTLGDNAEFSIDGGPIQTSTSNVVTGALSGVNITIKGTGTTTLDIAQDTSSAVNAVKEYVTAFNEAITFLRSLTAVDPTTNQRSIFTGDSLLQGIELRLRAVVNTADNSLGTAYKTLPSIGISTGAVGSTPGSTNTLEFNETKFTQALQADPDAVGAFLTSSTGPIAALNSYLQGMTAFTGPLRETQQSADRQLTGLTNQIRRLQDRLQIRQLALERKFADLEAAMAQLQAQSQRLAAQLSQLSGAGITGGQS